MLHPLEVLVILAGRSIYLGGRTGPEMAYNWSLVAPQKHDSRTNPQSLLQQQILP